MAIHNKVSPEKIEKILRAISDGTTLRAACRENSYPLSDWYRLIDKDKKLGERYAKARQDQAQSWGDKLVEELETEPDVARLRVKSETIRWLMAKNHVGMFGDNVKLQGTIQHGADKGLLDFICGRVDGQQKPIASEEKPLEPEA